MNGPSSIVNIDQKMAAMRLKNLELLKRYQEIEEDRQRAVRSGATTDIETMRGAIKTRTRITTNPQEVQHERIYRPPIRRKFENDRNDTQPQRAQRVDYNRLKHERARETTNQKPGNNSNNSELHEYAFRYRSENPNDTDEPTHAKKLVIVNNKADRIGSGRFDQQQRTQEQGQRKREERMRRTTGQNNVHRSGTNEFHLDVPPMPLWQNSPMHVQLIPTNINSHHAGMDHLINSNAEPIDQSAYMHNFVYPSPAQTAPFNGNTPVYFAHPSQSPQTHFHQYYPTRTFENSNRHSFHLPPFQSSPIFTPPLPQAMSSSEENPSTDYPARFRHFKSPEHENKPRPMSNDFERLHNSHYPLRLNPEHRFQFRPQSFYDFSSNNNNINFPRSATNNRYQRNNNNNNTSLPLSAYMKTDDSNNHWGTTYARRRPTPIRVHQQDKHQFPLSSYDPRQYGFADHSPQRNDLNNQSNYTRRTMNNSNEIDLIEEWWEDNNTELIGTDPTILKINSKTTVDDSGNSSLSTSMNFKETTSDEFVNPSSDLSTTDSHIIESLDKLQEELKLEEAVDERLASSESNKEPTTYDTAHFMQWAKEKFREELAGRLTAQEIEQHDAVTSDDEEEARSTNAEKLNALEDDLQEKLTIDEHPSKAILIE